MQNEIIQTVIAKCIDGKKRLKRLESIYCKHYKFDNDCMQGGCCLGERKYAVCSFKNPKECKDFELKRGYRNAE